MKHVDGDMEDLFRRAAAKYPLRTDSADWERLAADLDRDPGPPSGPDGEEERRRRGFFWWWLLLPLAGALGFYGWRATVRQPAHLSKTVITAPATTASGPATTPGTTATTASGPATTPGAAATTPGGEAVRAMGRQGAEAQKGKVQGGRTVAAGGRQDAGGVAGSAVTQGGAGTVLTQAGRTPAHTGGVSSGDEVSRERMRMSGRRPMGSTAKAGGTDDSYSGSTIGDANNDRFDAAKMGGGGVSGKGGNGGGGINSGGVGQRSKIDWRRAPIAENFSLVVDVKAPVQKDSSAKPAKKAIAKNTSGGYIGLSGAPDLSTVKMQATKGVGTTWGLLLGYAFNSRWAVESGVYLDRKKYYTAGEYFSKEGDPALGPYNIENVNGTCNMWEIPVNVRYNFNPGSKITWFATAGLSTYLMTKQQYTYDLDYNGGTPWDTNWSTKVHSNYLFSVVNFSGGFEQRIGNIGNLRIEPYLRIPLSGIGSGRLPIMSAGLSIGITRRLW